MEPLVQGHPACPLVGVDQLVSTFIEESFLLRVCCIGFPGIIFALNIAYVIFLVTALWRCASGCRPAGEHIHRGVFLLRVSCRLLQHHLSAQCTSKLLLTGRSGYVSGAYINLPSGHAFRVEPVLVQLATPNASIVGPLAGILVGLTYVYSAITPISDLV
ncbi:uncharacterized protein LOC119456976 [Dermacentor silvarum]|uniref:uncharacterized protein LOC119456976 n=1 Tax=Dermacentor silvarum TaxID=543639 RepID=UPI002100EDAC|nr:uncharacterized protein LOC119456976 [Dermacentor silvarum]